MRILIAYGSLGKKFHLKEFSNALHNQGVDVKLVNDMEYSKGFPSKNPKDWFFGNKEFKKLISDFKPDAVFIDRQLHFGSDVLKAKIPLFVLLRGHYWSEVNFAKKTIYKGLLMRTVIWFRNRIAEKIFKDATVVLPICKYLEKVVNQHHPSQTTAVFFEGINSSHWYNAKRMKLNHPCVGLLQDANWWGKTKEMLVLKKVLEKMPEVTFYWAGDGHYRQQVISELEKYKNFKWLGRLEYPDKVREYLNEIDIYALITGMDLAPLTLKEAQLMEKPVIGTDVGGVGEMMVDNQTGFLVKEGDFEDIIDKLTILINDRELAVKMGKEGKKFVVKSFSWEIIAKRFLEIIKPHIKNK